MFGDILSDTAAMLTGSIGVASASLDKSGRGMYEPVMVQPRYSRSRDSQSTGDLLSVAMMLRYSLGEPDAATVIEQAVSNVLDQIPVLIFLPKVALRLALWLWVMLSFQQFKKGI